MAEDAGHCHPRIHRRLCHLLRRVPMGSVGRFPRCLPCRRSRWSGSLVGRSLDERHLRRGTDDDCVDSAVPQDRDRRKVFRQRTPPCLQSQLWHVSLPHVSAGCCLGLASVGTGTRHRRYAGAMDHPCTDSWNRPSLLHRCSPVLCCCPAHPQDWQMDHRIGVS